jgi:hypothetical protein
LAARLQAALGSTLSLPSLFHWLMQPCSKNWHSCLQASSGNDCRVPRGTFCSSASSELQSSASRKNHLPRLCGGLPEVVQKPAPAVQAPKKHMARTPPDGAV